MKSIEKGLNDKIINLINSLTGQPLTDVLLYTIQITAIYTALLQSQIQSKSVTRTNKRKKSSINSICFLYNFAGTTVLDIVKQYLKEICLKI